jgi:hypothetical protein
VTLPHYHQLYELFIGISATGQFAITPQNLLPQKRNTDDNSEDLLLQAHSSENTSISAFRDETSHSFRNLEDDQPSGILLGTSGEEYSSSKEKPDLQGMIKSILRCFIGYYTDTSMGLGHSSFYSSQVVESGQGSSIGQNRTKRERLSAGFAIAKSLHEIHTTAQQLNISKAEQAVKCLQDSYVGELEDEEMVLALFVFENEVKAKIFLAMRPGKTRDLWLKKQIELQKSVC